MSAQRPNLRRVALALREALVLFERFEQSGDSLPQRILDALALGPASTATVTVIVRKRRHDVRSTLKLMAEAGQIVRDGRNWKLLED